MWLIFRGNGCANWSLSAYLNCHNAVLTSPFWVLALVLYFENFFASTSWWS